MNLGAKRKGENKMIEQIFTLTGGNEKVVEKVILDENLHYMHVIINQSDGFPEHYTNAVVYMTVMRGIVSLQIGDQDYYAYPAGTVLKIPSNTKMILNNFNPETLELILIKAPPPDVLPE
jgi:quercetin dioxygenase-like cupin family protein